MRGSRAGGSRRLREKATAATGTADGRPIGRGRVEQTRWEHTPAGPGSPASVRSHIRLLMLTTLALLLLASPPTTATEAVVTRVHSTDTIEVLMNDQPVEIRLAGVRSLIDAQPNHHRCLETARRVLIGRTLYVTLLSEIQYGRCVATATLDGRDVSTSILRAGLAWHDAENNADPALAAAQASAQRSMRGLWTAAKPVAPWVVAARLAKQRKDELAAARDPRSAAVASVATTSLDGVLSGSQRRSRRNRQGKGVMMFDAPVGATTVR